MPKTIQPKQVSIYANAEGYEPFTQWLQSLRDVQGRQRILVRIGRMEQGNYGDYAEVGNGVSELRLFFAPGYRVYFGEDGDRLVVLLCGGDKSTQTRDIEQAKAYWQEYINRE